jgi:hypothetical protein
VAPLGEAFLATVFATLFMVVGCGRILFATVAPLGEAFLATVFATSVPKAKVSDAADEIFWISSVKPPYSARLPKVLID